jgi:D-alanyl-D-alanine carboxypeptidase
MHANSNRRCLLIFAAIVLCASIGGAQNYSEPPIPPDCSAVPKNAAAQLDCDALGRIDIASREMVASGYTPGLVVVITRGNRVIFAEGYGLANVEADLAATPASVFPILSITKTFTASAIMQLRDAGKLSLDDKLSKYFPTFPRGDEVTLRNLLSHTSGIHDIVADNERMISSDSLVRLIIAQRPLFDFNPGEKYAYSNPNYVLLGRIVELVSGRPLRAFVRDSVVGRVPFVSIAVDQVTDVVHNRVNPYLRTTVPGRFANAPPVDPSVRFGSGSMRSSMLDLATWFNAFFAGKVVSAASLHEMMTPAKLKNGQLTGGDWGAYGYGLQIERCGGHTFVGHSGGTDSGNLIAHYYPDDDFMLFIAANTSHTAAQVEPRILKQIFGPDKVVGSCN